MDFKLVRKIAMTSNWACLLLSAKRMLNGCRVSWKFLNLLLDHIFTQLSCNCFRELWYWPRSLISWPQRRVVQSHNLSKSNLSSHTWRWARYQLCVRIDKLGQLNELNNLANTYVCVLWSCKLVCGQFNNPPYVWELGHKWHVIEELLRI